MKKTQVVVAQGIVVRGDKVLVGLRNSPDDPGPHGLWQCPGGKVEFGERPEIAMVRELQEETGFKTRVLSSTPWIANVLWRFRTYQVQVLLLTYPCKIMSGKLLIGGRENSAWKWITKRDFKKFKFTPGSDQALRWWFYGRKR